jgi:3-deoxy-D-manno-oct-2-ulosonic acid (Kdo) hydroxylase
MTPVTEIPIVDWHQRCPTAVQEQALCALEAGCVLFFPRLGFSIADPETQFLSPTTAAKHKNVSFNLATGKLGGSSLDGAAASRLAAMMRRFATCSNDLLLSLLPHYKAGLAHGRTSFRPGEIEGQSTSWRKDDTRLHVDSFPSSPVQDRRILRVFGNVNPHGRSRTWKLGASFESVARRHLASLSGPIWGSSWLLRLCRITRSRRSAYDHCMGQLHDRMKVDLQYQSGADQRTYDFPAGSTWIRLPIRYHTQLSPGSTCWSTPFTCRSVP